MTQKFKRIMLLVTLIALSTTAIIGSSVMALAESPSVSNSASSAEPVITPDTPVGTSGSSADKIIPIEPIVSPVPPVIYNKRIVSVTGSAVLTVVPDTAYILFGVETMDKNALVAQQQNKDKMNSVINALTKLNIKEEDIQTSNYSLYQEYNWLESKKEFAGYKVNNTVQVTIGNIDAVGKIIDTVTQNSANVIYNISFDYSASDKIYQDALKAAVKNAQDKAKAMVAYFGYKTVTPVSIKESSNYQPSTNFEAGKVIDSANGISTPVSPGKIKITATVNVDFQY